MRTSVSAGEVSSRAGAVTLGVALTLALLALAYAGAQGQHAWNLRLNEKAWLDWHASEAKRVASRYGEVRLPLRGTLCTSYAFDNLRGVYVNERQVTCETDDTDPSWAAPDAGYARLQGLANAFRR